MQITLPAIAFGGSASVSVMPSPRDARDRWLRAVALGGQGFYAAAATELRRIDDSDCGPALKSLAASTRAAHLRQGGRHHRAADHDGAALHIVGGGDPAGSDAVAARCDALTGLAADNLGRGMFGAADRLLERVEHAFGDRDQGPAGGVMGWVWGPRAELRWHWVRAELAMYTGDPTAAVEHAAAAQVVAAAGPSLRHRIKTELIGAAAAAASGDLGAAGDGGRQVFDSAAAAHQVPLQWAAAKLLHGISAGQGAEAASGWAKQAERLAGVLAERGGAMR